MDQINKALNKLTAKERKQLTGLLDRIASGDLEGLDIKKLVGKKQVYRVRKGDLRIVFEKQGTAIYIRSLERRSTNTYRKRG